MDNAKHLLERIRQEEVSPMPGWIFKGKDYVLWTVFIAATMLGAMAFSVILLSIQNADFNITSHLTHSKWEMFLGLLPFIWLVFVVLFLVLAMISIKNSNRGYKFSVEKNVLLSLLISMAIGTFFFMAGGSEQLEKAFDIRVSSYQSIEERKIQVWQNPEDGYLAGKIVSTSENSLTIQDFENNEWTIEFVDVFVPPVVLLEPNELIKIIGVKTGNQSFSADEIRPWGGNRMRPNRGNGPGRRFQGN